MKTLVVLLLLWPGISGAASELVSPFAGSEALGEFQADFVKFHYLPTAEESVESVAVEGRLKSRIYKKPAEKSNYEVFKSFEKELRAGGFEMLAVMDDTTRVELLVRDANGAGKNDMIKRRYVNDGTPTSLGNVAQIATQAQEYIAARKTIDQTDVLIVVFTSRSGNYAIERLESAAMEEGTVVLSLDALRSQIENEGRIAIYGILFDTGSAVVKPDSAETISTIVQYLRENPSKSFYVVGHTDDQGSFDSNMALSRARAQATVKVLLEQLPEARGRLQADGVGPLSPVATNAGTDGRSLNRRVELVSKLE